MRGWRRNSLDCTGIEEHRINVLHLGVTKRACERHARVIVDVEYVTVRAFPVLRWTMVCRVQCVSKLKHGRVDSR